jgi:hypothetical protein
MNLSSLSSRAFPHHCIGNSMGTALLLVLNLSFQLHNLRILPAHVTSFHLQNRPTLPGHRPSFHLHNLLTLPAHITSVFSSPNVYAAVLHSTRRTLTDAAQKGKLYVRRKHRTKQTANIHPRMRITNTSRCHWRLMRALRGPLRRRKKAGS